MKGNLKLEIPKTPSGFRNPEGKLVIPRTDKNSVRLEVDINKITTDDIHKITYFDGDGDLRIGSDDIPFNMYLLQNNKILCFLVDWKNYSDFEVFRDVLIHIYETDIRDSRKWKKQIVLYPTIFGILVTTKETWILKDICKLVKERQNQYEVSEVSEELLSELITPNMLIHYMKKYKDTSIEGDKYIIFIQYGTNNSIPVKRLNSLKYAKKYYEYLNNNKPQGYNLCLWDINNKESISGFTKSREYDIEVLDPDLDLERYLDDIAEKNGKLYSNSHILKLIRSLC